MREGDGGGRDGESDTQRCATARVFGCAPFLLRMFLLLLFCMLELVFAGAHGVHGWRVAGCFGFIRFAKRRIR